MRLTSGSGDSAGPARTSPVGGNAQLNPYHACLGLLRAARENGARIDEHSAIHRIKNRRTGVQALTRHGTVFAKQAVVATGYATKAEIWCDMARVRLDEP